MRNEFEIWINAVCQEIRFRPDRKGIAKELRIHYEDHVRDLLRLGRAPELAEQRALAAMGNAQEVGWALDRVHKPWLGWLWEISRVLTLALALLLAWKVLENDYLTRPLAETTWNQLTWAVPARADHAATDYLDLWLSAGEPEAFQDPDEEAVLPGETRVQVSLSLCLETRDVFHTELSGLYQGLEVTADGQVLSRGRSWQEDGSWQECGYWNFLPSRWGWTRHEDQILLVLSRPPRRVEVRHPGAGLTLAAEWGAAS